MAQSLAKEFTKGLWAEIPPFRLVLGLCPVLAVTKSVENGIGMGIATTFVLIFSSVTMVLAVDAGHKMQKNKVIIYLFLTIIGGAIFVGSQAWEWATFIKGDYGAIETKGGKIIHQMDHMYVNQFLLKRLGVSETKDSARIFGESLSDHLPIYSEFEIN